jgi:hypothetical protein
MSAADEIEAISVRLDLLSSGQSVEVLDELREKAAELRLLARQMRALSSSHQEVKK